MIKKYNQFINEAEESVVDTEKDNLSDSKFSEIKDEIKSMIEKTIEKSGGEFKSFVENFIKNPDDVKIEGLINDSDIYDFFLKWRNEIDEILNSIKFFNQLPTESNAFGLYEYVIKGTQKSIEEVVKMLK
jgi:hypothetical protein